MAIQKITIEEFLSLAKQHPILDVRSPGEYTHAHIPTAHNLPLFSDEERKEVGTAYKQQSREAAIKIGLDFFGVKMKKLVEETEGIVGSWQLAVSNLQPPDRQLPTARVERAALAFAHRCQAAGHGAIVVAGTNLRHVLV